MTTTQAGRRDQTTTSPRKDPQRPRTILPPGVYARRTPAGITPELWAVCRCGRLAFPHFAVEQGVPLESAIAAAEALRRQVAEACKRGLPRAHRGRFGGNGAPILAGARDGRPRARPRAPRA